MFQTSGLNSNTLQIDINHIHLDSSWLTARKGLYIKPALIDLANNSLTFYSLAQYDLEGSLHYHTGASYGVLLRGSLDIYEENHPTQHIDAGGFTYSPAGVLHRAVQYCDDKDIWLYYGTLVGNIIYVDENLQPKKSVDAMSTYKMAQDHCKEQDIDFQSLNITLIQN
ncbi:cupin domain-containing protein [Piscirickettsia litoralis]|uniref:Cupin 2 conserved barrel domain-containing protein n=1 Tax=Piscirickettsia litoralis TaxID=1891921 RepID=A0ABX3A0D7_9GAMM|nr:hypothetical protein [Piscirickettsia litoralis]ODN41940.1 hypothetical protein BGC07_01880 [Piscirickettsia litoralis]